MRTLVSLLAVATFLATSPTLPAQDADFDAKVEEAREKGVEWLISQQRADGSWEYDNHEVGITALCTLALVENGVSPTDEVIELGVDYIRENSKDLTNTYDIALSIVLLSTIGSRKDSDRIKALAASLLAGQTTSGGWTYSCPKGTKSMLTNRRSWPKPKVHPGDNSCTQFAVLGLWVASRNRVDIEHAMSGVARRFVYYQNVDGGWGYRLPTPEKAGDGEPGADAEAPGEDPNEDGPKLKPEPSKNSMTFAGLFCLTVARATRIRAEQEGDRPRRNPNEPPAEEPAVAEGEGEGEDFEDAGSEAQTLLEDPIFKKGLEKAAAYARGIGNGSAKYFLWSTERIGVMLGMEDFSGADWFQKSASAMLATQRPDGSWAGGHSPLSSTAFSILVLRKANLGSDITRLLEGEPAQPFGIVGKEERFDDLVSAVKAAEPGAVIRVEGDGPYEMPHLDIDGDLTIQAGFGYTPKFEYSPGSDEFGIRIRPENDPLARTMIRVEKGTLTLEGLKLEMDPPFTRKEDLDWTTVTVDGGNLRMLNCVLTEENKRGVVAVRILKPGTHVLRNCVLATTVSGMFVNGAGENDITLDNCIVFSDIAVDLRQDPKFKGESSLKLAVTNSTLQVREGFRFLSLPTFPIDVTFDANVVRADVLASYLAAAGRGSKNTWAASRDNLYDVDGWITVRRKSVSTVDDLDAWQRYWGHTEENSYDRIAGFTVRRPLNAFAHRVRPEDWELTDERYESGVYALTVGVGQGFSRFRSTIQYNRWRDAEPGTAVAVAE